MKHVGNYLQPAFTKENRTKPNAPFTNALTAAEVKGILNRSIRQSERYRAMKEQGATESEIQKHLEHLLRCLYSRIMVI